MATLRKTKPGFFYLGLGVPTGKSGAPFTQTLSAKRTLEGLDRRRARLLAERRVDFRIPCCSGGWHTTKFTVFMHARTSEITCSRGACFTSSPFTDRIWSPGSN